MSRINLFSNRRTWPVPSARDSVLNVVHRSLNVGLEQISVGIQHPFPQFFDLWKVSYWCQVQRQPRRPMETIVTRSVLIRNARLMLRFFSISTSWSWRPQGLPFQLRNE